MIYVVLGMHKSGTSLAAEILHKSGISMVNTDPVGTYEDGAYYERQDCFQLNMAILGWSDEELLYCKSELALTPVQAAQMRTIIAENEALGGDWGFKDPRTCLTYSLWSKYLPPHRLIIVYRPVEAIWHRYQYKGLRFWKHWQRAFGLVEAWLVYNEAIIRILQHRQSHYIVLSYQAFLAEDSEFQRLSRFVDRPLVDMRHKNPKSAHSDFALNLAKTYFKARYQSVLTTLESL